MTDCGLTDEEMGALQEAFPDVTFVWTLRIYVFFVPSDSDYFITNPDAGFKMNVHQQGPRGLYYLRNIRSLDLGHSLEKLRDLPGDYEVYPGHEGSTSLEYERRFNPYMQMALREQG